MSNHVHEWSVDHEVLEEISPLGIPYGRVFAYCGCGENIFNDEIVRRLNATERLNAEDAIAFIEHMQSEWQGHSALAVMLEAYVAALEGEHE